MGAVTGYSLDQVKAIPALTSAELLEYFDQTMQTLRPKMLALTPNDFERPATAIREDKSRSLYQWIRAITQGCFAHIGEIQAIKAIYERSHRAEAVQA